jgi:hypothetical protein
VCTRSGGKLIFKYMSRAMREIFDYACEDKGKRGEKVEN